MVDSHRDPDEAGHEWTAWWALQGDEPLSRVGEAAWHLQARLGDLGRRLGESGDKAAAETVAASRVFMLAIAQMLDDDGTSPFKAKIVRRTAGKPSNRLDRAHVGHRAAGIVIRLVSEGWKQEAALAQATAQTGLSRAETMHWLKSVRSILSAEVNSPNSQD